MKNYYTTLENNMITNGTYSVRWTGTDTDPQFVAMDIARNCGYATAQAVYRKFDPEYMDAQKGKGRNLIRSLSTSQVAEILDRKHKRTDAARAEFKKFWEDFVLPEFDERYKKIAEQKKEIERLANEIKKYQDKLRSIASIAA